MITIMIFTSFPTTVVCVMCFQSMVDLVYLLPLEVQHLLDRGQLSGNRPCILFEDGHSTVQVSHIPRFDPGPKDHAQDRQARPDEQNPHTLREAHGRNAQLNALIFSAMLAQVSDVSTPYGSSAAATVEGIE